MGAWHILKARASWVPAFLWQCLVIFRRWFLSTGNFMTNSWTVIYDLSAIRSEVVCRWYRLGTLHLHSNLCWYIIFLNNCSLFLQPSAGLNLIQVKMLVLVWQTVRYFLIVPPTKIFDKKSAELFISNQNSYTIFYFVLLLDFNILRFSKISIYSIFSPSEFWNV